MSQSANTLGAVEARPGVPQEILMGDEVVLLAIKPSGWFLLLVKWPVLAAAGLLAGSAALLEHTLQGQGAASLAYLLALAAAMARLVIAALQWMGRVYVLTDRRIMRIRGVLKVDVLQCPLRQVRQMTLTATRAERALGLGTFCFEIEAAKHPAFWRNVSRPQDVRAALEDALRRAGGGAGR